MKILLMVVVIMITVSMRKSTTVAHPVRNLKKLNVDVIKTKNNNELVCDIQNKNGHRIFSIVLLR